MIPQKPLPYSDGFSSTEEYVDTLLDFTCNTDIFHVLTGGVHILDFWATEPSLFERVLPPEWQPFLLACPPVDFLDLLMRKDLDSLTQLAPLQNTESDQPMQGTDSEQLEPPESLISYIRQIRRLTLDRTYHPKTSKLAALPRNIAVGMKIKKVHEVTAFAGFIDRVSEDFASATGEQITHLVDFGCGQNYLGRTLASPPYDRDIIAIESREINIEGAKWLDILAGVAEAEKVFRNKKKFLQARAERLGTGKMSAKHLRMLETLKLEEQEAQMPGDAVTGDKENDEAVKPGEADFRPTQELEVKYSGGGTIQYVEGRVESGDLSEILAKINVEEAQSTSQSDKKLMAMSIHSCGNLSHHGIRSLILNPEIRAVAIVGCCYQHVTDRLPPSEFKFPLVRPSLQALNGRLIRAHSDQDPQGFPMSEKVATYGGCGVRLNVTARMMACQSPHNWGEDESQAFFNRHYFRAVLQRLLVDRGVVLRIGYGGDRDCGDGGNARGEVATNPVIIGTLPSSCFNSFTAYVRGATKRLMRNPEFCDLVVQKMGNITDEEIVEYETRYGLKRRELSSAWSLMAFSAQLVEALLVVDRWTYLKEHDEVAKCWVEPVFDYKLSPRNLVVVGLKK